MALAARRLVVTYAAVTLFLDLAVLLPGNPEYSSGWGWVGLLGFQALIVWRLWHGSMGAWLFGLLASVLSIVALYLTAAPMDFSTSVFAVLLVAQIGVLAAPT